MNRFILRGDTRKPPAAPLPTHHQRWGDRLTAQESRIVADADWRTVGMMMEGGHYILTLDLACAMALKLLSLWQQHQEPSRYRSEVANSILTRCARFTSLQEDTVRYVARNGKLGT